MFAVCLIITLHGVVSMRSATVPTPQPEFFGEVGLCCYWGDGWAQQGGGDAGEGKGSGDGERGGHAPPGQCSLAPPASFPRSHRATHNNTVICLDIVCSVDGDREHLVCALKPHSGQADVDRVVTLSLQCLRPEPQVEAALPTLAERAAHSSCHGEGRGNGVLQCPLPPGSMGLAVSLAVTVSLGDRSAVSAAMRFTPQHLVRPDPPANLRYNVTTEGELTLSWTDPQSSAGPLAYDVRYTSNTSLNSWVHVDNVRTQPMSLADLITGVTYTVQVRCKILGKPALWSGWSQNLLIYLHEVTYIPETVFTGMGDNVTVYCIFNNRSLSARNVVWWLNAQEKVPESQYSVLNDRVSSVTLPNVRPLKRQPFNVLHCCQRSGETSLCSYRYASLYTEGVSVAISCESNGDLSAMTCRWNSLGVKFYYRRRDLPCDIKEEEVGMYPAEECPIEGRGLNSCTFKPLLPLACYVMWLEFGNEKGTVKSQPVYVTPMDFVKPCPPFDLEALTVPEGYLRAKWARPELPAYELRFELRYAVDEPDAQWRVFKSEVNQMAVFPVLDPCVIYTVMVRCKRLGGPGFWSDWSDLHYSTVQLSRAPERGPDFWRILKDDQEQNQTNVTLLFSPLTREEALCCVEGFVVQHQTRGGAMWIEKLGLVSTYTFPWREEDQTVIVLAINSLGLSTRNTNMTLARKNSKSRAISTLSSVMVNGSCVVLAWDLLPNSSAPASFVLEWTSRSRGRAHGDPGPRVKWVRVPASSRSFYLHDKFYASEEYQFILYPIFVNGEGEPVYNKEDRGRPSSKHAAYTLLLIIAFLSVVLFLTLGVSQHQMMKLVWKDVPNPNNCSWAQGVDFRKAETVENLFRHPERLTSCPLLLETETVSEAVIVEVLPAVALEEERAGWVERALQMSTTPSSSSSSSSSSACGLDRSSITYATVLPTGERGRAHRRPQERLRSCSDEGNFSANASDLSGSYPEAPWEPDGVPSNLRRSYTSTEEFSENSDQEDQSLDGTGSRRDLCCSGLASKDEEEGFGTEATLEHLVESCPLLDKQDPRSHGEEWSGRGIPFYVPQFQTAAPVSESQSKRGL
ncbi:hypothetical protein AAFF_G00228140 [Aldrovandia affinis]|uniref:Fibronectin type-III domain-containing protein n=1 Tax=Aldrovandia affinis TaxID=143900 RepID=A0AAD7SW95_9TELE|nr:hypothetical protein AAFF_G00228140 [Aldrovandia affinis]